MRKLLLPLLLACGLVSAQQIVIVISGLTQATPPTYSPDGGNFHSSPQAFTLTSPLGGTVGYTSNGTTPTLSNVQTCPSPCSLSSTPATPLWRAISIVSGDAVSQEADATFSFTVPPTSTPTMSPDPGIFVNTIPTVTVSDVTPAAVIYCTQDGTPPTAASPVYTGPVTFSTPGTVNFQCGAQASGFTFSGIFGGNFTYNPPGTAPVIAPASGPYVNSVTVTITDPSCPTAPIYYSTTGAPTTSSTLYSGPFTLTQSAIVQAMDVCPNYSPSPPTTANYTVGPPQQAPTPNFAPPSGTQVTTPATIPVSISGIANATIIYTTNGSQPSLTNGTSCTAPCGPTLSAVGNYTVLAIETVPGYSTSAVGSSLYSVVSGAPAGACSGSAGTSGTLTVVLTPAPRTTGTSPYLQFYNATNSTDSATLGGANNTFQDVTYTWNFGDSGASGTGFWQYGSNPNKNSKNMASGAIAAHLYITSGADVTYTATVTATDGTNTVTCTAPPVSAYDPTDAPPNGFGGVATTCVSAAALPVAGVGGCPAGAAVLQSASYSSAIGSAMGNNKQVLFHCGESFTGSNATINAVHFSTGAYGSCVGMGTGLPIIQVPQTSVGICIAGNYASCGSAASFQSSDGRISDLDFEGSGTFTVSSTNTAFVLGASSGNAYPTQVTMWDVISNNIDKMFQDYDGTQIGLVQAVMKNAGQNQGVYINSSANQCANGAKSYNCNGTSLFDLVDYNALLGGHFNAAGNFGLTSGPETVRISACRLCVIENNDFQNATSTTAVLKFNSANDGNNTSPPWFGQYSELFEISDNRFTGTSGAQLVEVVTENAQSDERIRLGVIERNLFAPSGSGARGVQLSTVNVSVRDNVFQGMPSGIGISIARRGVEWVGGDGAPSDTNAPELNEVYNNTCNGTGACASPNPPGGYAAAANNSWWENNLVFNPSGGTVIATGGSGNTVSNNSATITLNPGFVNSSGTFSLISDFVPIANYSGGIPVPVFYDALGTLWAPGWDLGAVSHSTGFKFFAGDAAMSVQYQHNMSGSQWIADIAALKAHPAPGTNANQMYVAGWHWPFLESGSPGANPMQDAISGTGEFAGFQNILTVYTALENPSTGIPGAHFGISLMGTVYGGNYSASVITTRPWNTTGEVVPGYIATAGGTGSITVPVSLGSTTTMTCQIAPIYTGASYGGFAFTNFDGTDMQQASPAWWNPCINQLFINWYQALSVWQYTAPSGHPLAGQTLTLDTDPLVSYIFSNDEDSYNFKSGSANNPTGVTVSPPLYNVGASPSNTPSNTNFTAAYKAWANAVTGFFPHTLIGTNFTFGFGSPQGTDTPANMAAYTNQYIGGATALSTIRGLALSAADTYGVNFTGGGTRQQANCALQGYVGIPSPGCFSSPSALGAVTNTSLAGYMPNVALIQPTDYASFLPSGCAANTSCAVTAISAQTNNSYVQDNLRIWVMGDNATGGTTAWTTYVAPTLNGAGSGVTPYSTVQPTNLPGSPVFNFFTQPTVNSAAGNTYIASENGFNYGGVWIFDSVEPPTCSGGSDPSGLFPTTFNAVSLTGLSATAGNLSYSSGTGSCTSPQSSASTLQAVGTAMGTYINSNDVACLAGSPPICKLGVFEEIWWAKPSTTPTALTNPFVNYNGIQINFWAQVPTATWPGMPAVGNTSTTGASYGAFDLAFEDLNGNQVVFDATFFFGGQGAQTKCEPVVQDNQGGTAWELKCQIASTADANPYVSTNPGYMTWLAGAFSSTTFSGYQQFTYNITQANFQQALNDIKAHGASVPANFSTNVNAWGLLHGHFNDECYHISGPCSLGTSEHDLTITFF